MTQKQIIETIELDLGLKLVAESFTEVAAIKLQRIRSRIERNRTFSEEISGLFTAIKKLAAAKGTLPNINKKGTAVLLVSSNYRFYGGLERRLIDFYLNSIRNLQTDKIIIGKSGNDFLSQIGQTGIQKIVWKDDLPSEEDLKTLANLINSYQRVFVFYPQFRSVLVQIPQVVDIKQTGILQKPIQNFVIDYILEPELEKMVQFFETQILGLILEQTFLEAELSRTAARLISMDQAQENADDAISELKKTLAATKRTVSNNQILETESAMFKIREANNDFR